MKLMNVLRDILEAPVRIIYIIQPKQFIFAVDNKQPHANTHRKLFSVGVYCHAENNTQRYASDLNTKHVWKGSISKYIV